MDLHRVSLSGKYLLSAILSSALAVCCFVYPWRLACTQMAVANISNAELPTLRRPPGFMSQNPHTPALSAFRRELAGVAKPNSHDLEVAIAIRKWCRAQQIGDWSADDNSSENPKLLLDRQRRGVPGTCRRFAYVFAGALLAGGLDSRVVNVSAGIYDSSSNHTLVEVWIRELGKWILMDSMYNTMFLVDGTPASLLELSKAMTDGNLDRVRFERNGSVTEPHPILNRAFAELFRHVFYSMTNGLFDGYKASLFAPKRIAIAHYTAPGGRPYPESLKQTLLWCSLSLLAVGCICAVLGIVEFVRQYAGATASGGAPSKIASAIEPRLPNKVAASAGPIRWPRRWCNRGAVPYAGPLDRRLYVHRWVAPLSGELRKGEN